MLTSIALLLAAPGLAAPLTPRPTDLVPPGQQAAYEAWFAGRTAQLTRLHARGPCLAPTARSVSFRLIGPKSVLHNPTQEATIDGAFYREAYTAEGCGALPRQNMAVAHLVGGGWRGIGTLPGMTIADPFLQNDAGVMAATAAVTRPAPGCSFEAAKTSVKIVDTALIGAQPPQGAPWTERWTFTTCGAPVTVRMSFIPTPGGGTSFGATRESRVFSSRPSPAAPAPRLR